MTGPRASCLYVGWTRHRRVTPVERTFRYRTFHALLDVDELPALEREVAGFAYRRAAPVRFRDRDHLGAGDTPVKAKLARWLRAQGLELPDGPVRVLANLRVLGHVFDPVSWWFCHRADGSLALVVAEVRNTFGESYWYLLDELEDRGGGVVRARAPKRFHVSPFLPIDGLTYRFTFVLRPERVVAHIEVLQGEETVFDATQTGRRRPFTTRSLLAVLLANPLLPLRTVALIHLQALRLLVRRVRFHRKPEPPPGAVVRDQREPAVPDHATEAGSIPPQRAHEHASSA
ncbi:MAG: DUF1365 domain-containing protein [Nitriliruptoraceae bacterium]